MERIFQGANDGDGESVSAVHHALRSTRRRIAVILIAREFDLLAVEDDPCGEDTSRVTVRGLSRATVSLEHQIPESQATGEPYHNVYTSLVQTHLPGLEDIGAIRFDSHRKTIQPSQNLLALTVMAVVSPPLVNTLFDPGAVSDEVGLDEVTSDPPGESGSDP